MRHHTKDKGDKGLGFVISDLMSNGIQVALPISEHLPFDLIAISEDNELKRVSVKFRKKYRGIVSISFRSMWSDRNGVHIRKHDKNDYDVIAIYCPDTKECYYINVSEVSTETVCLRTDDSKNKNKNIRKSDDYKGPNRIFKGA